MALEIERKFLVRNTDWRAGKGQLMRQGYLGGGGGTTVRVRLAGERAWLTIKGPTTGATRAEYEYAIPADDARDMLASLCPGPLVEKRRFEVEHAGFTWEVDEFLGDNTGLVVAEIELESEDQLVPLPAWVGEEVTGDPRYYNASLARHPYRQWR
ncbi:CYTH domain-containing protein [Parahaliea mediterranea]|uniref:CYTH domain-containing protein n=1 Tax=Parahaliea mediterranea TaxID=651086 RepID=A0A939DGY5_9GAMM|nr:CYTH domain-containing protein [Parahaliea mediterranea]MBN7797666.1 CYTH domain-containing protein [Parahaliea mediterranea]